MVEEVKKCEEKEVINLVVLGPHGSEKTSLIARLILEYGGARAQKMLEHASNEASTRRLSYMIDTRVEFALCRSDHVKHIKLDVGERRYHLMDTPGSRKYIGNTIQGIAQADAALLVINGEYSPNTMQTYEFYEEQ